ncbi:MAG TPA: DsbA family oxidoreductase [Lysobacter sp.]|nr:DsbA family oxidoreductase [Lysobacter sp.]
MSKPLRIDFVSDVSCPWCAVGLKSLQQAMANVGDAVAVDLHFQPFELNPQMPPEGQDTNEHLAGKYGLDADQLAQNREVLRQRGAEVGFTFNQRSRVYNTFDAHRLLHWAGEQGRAQELALKDALLHAYFTDDLDVSSHEVLTELAGTVGLDIARARQVLASDEFAAEVRAQERLYQERGIHAVPAVIINERHLIQGGQPVELFEQALRQIAAAG